MPATMWEIVETLAPLNRAVCSPGYDRAIEYLCTLLPFRVLEFDSDRDYNGWVVPPYWEVLEARIERDGRLIYDGTSHPLALIAQSLPFQGRLSREELRRHLHFDHRFADAIPFHYRQQFRSWDRDWGFCVPRTLYDSLPEGNYEVRIVTRESHRPLRMVELTLPGDRPETIAICANLDHAGVANDGVSGVAVGVELFRRLQGRHRRFSYRLVLCQGILGSEFYLGRQAAAGREAIFEALCLWMLGSRTPHALQSSLGGRSNIEQALAHTLRSRAIDFRRGGFREILINDEYVWESHGIATASLSRYPYPEYHSSRDNMSIISADSLEESVGIVDQALLLMEGTPLIRKRFTGTVCLSNPRYDLYMDAGQIALGKGAAGNQVALRRVMDAIPTLQGAVTVASLAERFDLPAAEVEGYLRLWERKGLISLD